MINELISDRWQRPHLEHEPAFCCHAASRMQRVHRLETLPPRHFLCTKLCNSNTDPTLQPALPALDAMSSPPSSQATGPSSGSTTASRAPHGRQASPLGLDHIIFNTHPYFVFDGAPNDSPITTNMDSLKAGRVWPWAIVEYKPWVSQLLAVFDGCEWDTALWWRLLDSITRGEHLERASIKQFALAPMALLKEGVKTSVMPIDPHELPFRRHVCQFCITDEDDF
ncbi:hypothetical protein DFH08DRAFT_808266 [Mycena albidolilacea]|uniref:Uncharacterized protein n=1 Tax=Mycena albidolilacea TaxID=1033008 RepID=A0AAD7A2Z2_9AGAR|nr:hypothetical protein DFH08DRAFT_808266 [Mycena albidolilacea]